MSNFLVVLLVAVSGVGLSVQVAVNSRLRETVQSPALSGLISFAVGLVVMLLLTLSGVMGRGRWVSPLETPWWYWIGGLFGALVVTTAIVALPKIGAGGVVAATVFGQLVTALVLDHFGWLGVKRDPITVWKAAGAVLLLAGVLLIHHRGR